LAAISDVLLQLHRDDDDRAALVDAVGADMYVAAASCLLSHTCPQLLWHRRFEDWPITMPSFSIDGQTAKSNCRSRRRARARARRRRSFRISTAWALCATAHPSSSASAAAAFHDIVVARRASCLFCRAIRNSRCYDANEYIPCNTSLPFMSYLMSKKKAMCLSTTVERRRSFENRSRYRKVFGPRFMCVWLWTEHGTNRASDRTKSTNCAEREKANAPTRYLGVAVRRLMMSLCRPDADRAW
jgi:hypothetical protein